MALQKGERCCGKQEGSAGIICGFLHGKLPVTKTIQGRDGQENLFRRPKNTPKKPQTKLNPPIQKKRRSLLPQRTARAHRGRVRPWRAEDICSLGNFSLCSTILGSSWEKWQMGHGDVRAQAGRLWWPPEHGAAAAHGHHPHGASKRSHLLKGKVNSRDN